MGARASQIPLRLTQNTCETRTSGTRTSLCIETLGALNHSIFWPSADSVVNCFRFLVIRSRVHKFSHYLWSHQSRQVTRSLVDRLAPVPELSFSFSSFSCLCSSLVSSQFASPLLPQIFFNPLFNPVFHWSRVDQRKRAHLHFSTTALSNNYFSNERESSKWNFIL